jgi:hypothetical protein
MRKQAIVVCSMVLSRHFHELQENGFQSREQNPKYAKYEAEWYQFNHGVEYVGHCNNSIFFQFNSYLFACKLNSPEANYKVSTSNKKKQNTKQGSLHSNDSNSSNNNHSNNETQGRHMEVSKVIHIYIHNNNNNVTCTPISRKQVDKHVSMEIRFLETNHCRVLNMFPGIQK